MEAVQGVYSQTTQLAKASGWRWYLGEGGKYENGGVFRLCHAGPFEAAFLGAPMRA